MERANQVIKGLFYITLIVIIFLSLIPSDSTQHFDHQDKLYHLIAYGVLSFLGQIGYQTKKKPFLSILISILLIICSIFIEWLQQYTYRDPSWYDVIANGIGIVIGLIIAKSVLYTPEESENQISND